MIWTSSKCKTFVLQKTPFRGFPGSSVARSLSANLGDMGSISGPGGSHMKRLRETARAICHNYWACPLEPKTTTTEATCHATEARVLQRDATAMRSSHTTISKSPSMHDNKDPAQPRNKWFKKKRDHLKIKKTSPKLWKRICKPCVLERAYI